MFRPETNLEPGFGLWEEAGAADLIRDVYLQQEGAVLALTRRHEVRKY